MTTEVIAGAAGVRRRNPRHPGARVALASVWSAPVPPDAASSRVLPDAHIDLVWVAGRLYVAGPDTTAHREVLPPGHAVLGFQLAPGAAPAVLGAPASAVRDDRVDLAELWDRTDVEPVVDALQAAPDSSAAAAVVEAAVAARISDRSVDSLAAEIRHRISAGARLRDLDDLPVGERQLRRRCRDAFGYGPKVLARVLRFQAFVDRLSRRPDLDLAATAGEAGYADQSHLTHEVGALAGMTPGELRARMVSDFDKTGAP